MNNSSMGRAQGSLKRKGEPTQIDYGATIIRKG